MRPFHLTGHARKPSLGSGYKQVIADLYALRQQSAARKRSMERAMRGLGESAVHRIVVIGGATAVVMAVLLVAKPFYSAMTNPKAPSGADESQPVANQEPATEKVSFVASPTME